MKACGVLAALGVALALTPAGRADAESGPKVGDKVPALKARRGPHVPVRSCERACRPDGSLCSDCGRACPSCGEPSRFPGGRCDSCFAAALRVVPTHVRLRRGCR